MKCILPIVLACYSSQAHATSPTDGNKLYEECGASPTNVDGVAALVACNNYIVGVVDGYSMTSDAEKWMALPVGVKGQQLQDIVQIYLTQHPEVRHRPASFLIMFAVGAAFPRSTLPKN